MRCGYHVTTEWVLPEATLLLSRSIVGALIMAACLSVSAHADPARTHRTPCEIAYPSNATIEWECRTLRSGESLEKLFGERWLDVARFNRIDRRHVRAGISITKSQGQHSGWYANGEIVCRDAAREEPNPTRFA